MYITKKKYIRDLKITMILGGGGQRRGSIGGEDCIYIGVAVYNLKYTDLINHSVIIIPHGVAALGQQESLRYIYINKLSFYFIFIESDRTAQVY